MPDDIMSNVEILEFTELSPQPYKNSCITIGNFDGVHRGHQAIIQRMVREADLGKRPVLVVTFFPSPADYFNGEETPYYLSSPQEKEEQLLQLGVDAVIVFKFNRGFANLTPEQFLLGLKENLGLATLVVGHDFALGKHRTGTLPVLRTIGDTLSFDVEVIPPVTNNAEEISSTRIRQDLDAGDVRSAALLLGRPYRINGVVSHGSDRGSRIGLPTANLIPWPKKKLPAIGVYATLMDLKGATYQGITNVGLRPTFETQEQPNIETHLLDFDGNIYGETVSLHFLEKIRDERKFSGVDELLAQIERDKVTASRIFNNDET